MRKLRFSSSIVVVSIAFFAAYAVSTAAQVPQLSASRNATRSDMLKSPEVERRVDALLKKMTLEEKLGQLVQFNANGTPASIDAGSAAANIAANPEVNYTIDVMHLIETGRVGSLLNCVGAAKTNAFQHAAVEKSRLHIPLLIGADVIHGFRTIYPIPLGLAASFDPELVERLSRMAAQEATTAGVRWFYSPMVDVSRDARWGRSSEGAGEDPYLGAAMARAYIRGYQGQDLSKPDSVAATVKHFAAYGGAEAGRDYNTTDMSLSRLHQVYLPPYKAAVEAGSATVMSAFNALNGVPSTANSYLLKDVLRDQWGFKGFVVSDYTAVMELINHGIALDGAQAAEKAFNAGTDVDMMSHLYDTQLPKLLASGKVSQTAIDDAVRRVLRVKFALGLFEHPYASRPEVTSAVAAHRPLVRQAAEDSFVLLQNKLVKHIPVLPLNGRAQTIALIGPLADDSSDMQGSWSGGRKISDVITLKDAMVRRACRTGTTLLYATGTGIESSSDGGFKGALQAAERADVIVMALGESSSMTGEAASRASLNLPGNQEDLLKQVVATGKPVVLLVFSGRPLALKWEAEHVPAIMEVWFPGTEAGNALVDVLYGNRAPSGKLPMSFPYAVGQEPLYYSQFPTGRPASPMDLKLPPSGNTRFVSRYIDMPNSALFPFGFGLSYTTFTYSNVKVSRSTVPLEDVLPGKKDLIVATATVKNTGNRTGTEVVQCYLRDLGTSLEQPMRSLKGFTRITLAPGESKTVSFRLGFDELSFYDNTGTNVVEPSKYTVWIGGNSLASLHTEFQVTSSPAR